jgi:cathepsin A (carboxypeptidase C)
MIGNGLIAAADRVYGYWETLCTTNPGVPEPIFNKTRCDSMAEAMPRCMHVIDACYKYPDAAICNAALEICYKGVIGLYDNESYKGGRNRFDITAPCDRDDICYASSSMIESYLNSAKVREALQVPKALNYSMMSSAVASAFGLTNDHGVNTETQIRYILENEIDVLIYQVSVPSLLRIQD